MSESVSIPAAFFFGLLSFFSPCVLPLVPAYLSYMSGTSIEELTNGNAHESAKRVGFRSLLFVLGFSIVFSLMGATASSIGQMLNAKAGIIMRVGGAALIVLGLHMLGLFKIRALYSEKRIHMKMSNVSGITAFLIGVTFAFGWTPCIGPTLATILALAANSSTVTRGILLLSVYSLGLGVPFLITGFATTSVLKALMRFRKYFRVVEVANGAFIILIGTLVFCGKFAALTSMLNAWLPQGK